MRTGVQAEEMTRGREYEERGEPRKRGRIYRYEKERSYEHKKEI